MPAVDKGQVGKGDIPPYLIRRLHILPVIYFRLLIEDFPDTAGGSGALGEHVDGVPAGQHGPDQHIDILVEGYKTAQGYFSHESQIAAIDKCDEAAQSDDDVKKRHDHGLQAYHVQVFIHGVPVCPGKGAHLGAFSYKGLDDADAGKAFLHKVRQIGNGLLAFPEPGVHDFAVVNFPGADEQHGDDCQKRKTDIDIVHHLAYDHYCHDTGIEHTDDSGADCHPDRIQITCEAGHQIPGFMFVIIFHAHFFQMAEHIVAKLFFNGTGCPEQEKTPEKPSQRQRQAQSENGQKAQPDAIPVQ